MKTTNRVKNIAALLLGLFISFALLELFLRLYNPFSFRIKAGEIVLPINQQYVIENNTLKQLDRIIVHTKNSLGFRGENPPDEFKNYLSLITVGGSTTECYYLSDDKTWPHLVGQKLKKTYHHVWVNNAGLDGHSTFGHTLLIRNHLAKIKPKIILFLVGCNDIGRDDLNEFEKSIISQRLKDAIKPYLYKIQIFDLLMNFKRYMRAKRWNLVHYAKDIKKLNDYTTLQISEEKQAIELQQHRMKYLKGYEERLSRLVALTKGEGIDPIIITQPLLWGVGVDDMTSVDLSTIEIRKGLSSGLYWRILESYNDVSKKVGQEKSILVIDLAHNLEKNPIYYYDGIHFTNEGAEEVSRIIYRQLKKYIDKHWNSFLK